MAVQQRIIGGGLLVAGVAVVLILVYLFSNKGMPWDEAYDKFRKDIHPRYVKAEEAGDYLALREIAEEANDLEKSTAMASVMQEIRAEVAKGNAQAQALLKLFDSNAFVKNAEDQYALDGEWYDRRTHSVLRLLNRSLSDATSALLDARRTAKEAVAAVGSLRLGSGLALPLPPAAGGPDAALFAVFGLKAGDVTAALAAKGESAKAKSARLVWNQAETASGRARLAQELAKVPGLADAIERAAVALGKSDQDVKGLDTAKKHAAQYVKTAASQLAAGLEGPAREAFEKDATIATVADALKQDAKLLKGYASDAPALGQALAKSFAP